MKSTMKKILSILCVAAMVFGCVHIGMFAEEAETPARERSGSAPVSENAPASEPADVGQASPSGQQETQQEQEEQQYASGIVTRYQIRVNGEPIRVPVPARDDVAIARIIVDTAQLIHILLRTPNLRIGMYFVNEADPYNYGKPFYSEDGQLLLNFEAIPGTYLLYISAIDNDVSGEVTLSVYDWTRATPAPAPVYQQPVVEEQQPIAEEQQPIVEEQQPVVEEQQQPAVEEQQQPAVEEQQQPVVEEQQQPAVEEQQQPVVEEQQQPVVEEQQQPIVEEQQQPAQQQQQPAQQQPAVEEQQQPVVEEQQPAQEAEPQPAEEPAEPEYVPETVFVVGDTVNTRIIAGQPTRLHLAVQSSGVITLNVQGMDVILNVENENNAQDRLDVLTSANGRLTKTWNANAGLYLLTFTSAAEGEAGSFTVAVNAVQPDAEETNNDETTNNNEENPAAPAEETPAADENTEETEQQPTAADEANNNETNNESNEETDNNSVNPAQEIPPVQDEEEDAQPETEPEAAPAPAPVQDKILQLGQSVESEIRNGANARVHLVAQGTGKLTMNVRGLDVIVQIMDSVSGDRLGNAASINGVINKTWEVARPTSYLLTFSSMSSGMDGKFTVSATLEMPAPAQEEAAPEQEAEPADDTEPAAPAPEGDDADVNTDETEQTQVGTETPSEEPAEETNGEEGIEPAEETDGEEGAEPADETDGEEGTEPAADTGDEAQEPLTADALLPDYASVSFDVTWDGEPALGATARFHAVLVGYDGLDYILQWQSSVDNVNWTDIEGANGEVMDVVITEDNCTLYWRVKVFIRVAQES